MAIRTEIVVRLQNSPGALARVCGTLADERVNVLGMALDPSGTFRAVVDNHVHAIGILRERHYDVQERDVLYTLLPNEPGALARVGRMVAGAGINLEYAYGTGIEGSAMASVVLGVEDAQRASAAAGI